MPSPADRMAGHPEQGQDHSDHDDNNANCPDDDDLRDEPDNEQDNAENDQVRLLAVAAIRWPQYLAGTGLGS
jgi:hypothetical protein